MNLAETNRRFAHRIHELEERLSELLGQQAFERSGLGVPATAAGLQTELEHHKQLVIELRARLDEREEELAAAREANRSLMAELNGTRARSMTPATPSLCHRHVPVAHQTRRVTA